MEEIRPSWLTEAALTRITKSTANTTRNLQERDHVLSNAWNADALVSRWGIENVSLVPNAYRSLLLKGTYHGLPTSLRVDLLTPSLDAVQYLSDCGAGPSLLESDRGLNASLVLWVNGRPSVSTDHRNLGDNLARFWGSDLGFEVRTFQSRLDEIRDRSFQRRAEFPNGDLVSDESWDRWKDLVIGNTTEVLCHGDLWSPNIIVDQEGDCWFVDTDPHMGPREWDLTHWALRTIRDVSTLKMVYEFIDRYSLNERVALECLFAQTIILAAADLWNGRSLQGGGELLEALHRELWGK